MIEFLKNIIPRIQQYSQGLDKIEVFVDKTEPWIYVDEHGGQHQYIFLREGKRLIMISNGVTKVGKWELLPTNQLLIDRISDLITLDHLFVEKALLVLKKSGTDDLPFVLISRQHIPDLNADAYLEKFELEKEIDSLPVSNQPYKILIDGKLHGPEFYEGKVINTFDDVLLNGTYETANSIDQYVVIANNVIKKVYFKRCYNFKNFEIIIDQKNSLDPAKGDVVCLNSEFELPRNQFIDIHTKSGVKYSVKLNENCELIKVRELELMWLSAFAIWVILVCAIIFFVFYRFN